MDLRQSAFSRKCTNSRHSMENGTLRKVNFNPPSRYGFGKGGHMKFRYDIAMASTPLLLLLGACGTASAVTPNSSDPAHCVAAFSYGRTLAAGGKSPDIALSVQSTARAIFEGKKIKANGAFETGEREGTALLAQFGKDEKVMMGLLLDCAKHQDADPAYRALNESGQLMAAARKVDPACQSNAECRRSTR